MIRANGCPLAPVDKLYTEENGVGRDWDLRPILGDAVNYRAKDRSVVMNLHQLETARYIGLYSRVRSGIRQPMPDSDRPSLVAR